MKRKLSTPVAVSTPEFVVPVFVSVTVVRSYLDTVPVLMAPRGSSQV